LAENVFMKIPQTFPDTGNDHNSESRGFYRDAFAHVKP
jgi:hypothetical protein